MIGPSFPFLHSLRKTSYLHAPRVRIHHFMCIEYAFSSLANIYLRPPPFFQPRHDSISQTIDWLKKVLDCRVQ